MNKFKKELISQLKKNVPKDKNIISISLVGSFVDKRTFGQSEDIDIVIIIKEMSAQSFIKIRTYLNYVCKSLSNSQREVYPAFKEGPIKPKVGKKQSFMLHIGFSPLERLRRLSKNLVCDWGYHNRMIYGKRIFNLVEVRRFNEKDLLTENNGVPYVKNFLLEKRIQSSTWMISNGELVKKLIKRKIKTNEQLFEVIQYAVIVSLLNIARLKNPRFKKDKLKLIAYAGKNLSGEHFALVKEIYKTKSEPTKKISTAKVNLLEKKALKFLDHLIKELKKEIIS